jgi:hypothetical protein
VSRKLHKYFLPSYYTWKMLDYSLSKTPEEHFLQFSTPPHDERWWRLDVRIRDLRWIQKNLGHGLEHEKRFRTTPRTVALSGDVYEDCPWVERVSFMEDESAPSVLVSLGDAYNYRSAYAEARKKKDPLLSPHGLFRNLEPGYHKHAFQFMQQFGPLFIESSTRLRGESWWLSLADFWDRQARFLALAKLWEDRFDPHKLQQHWAALGDQHERLDRAGAAPLGCIPDPIRRFIPFCRMPWQAKDDQIRSPTANASLQQRRVYELVKSELILHTQDCVLTWNATAGESSRTTVFEPTRSFTSLWGAMWELFGLDTRQYGWKLCQLCGKLFYPKDQRSVCCGTEHQSLWSKRVWARKHRAEVRKKVSKKRSK